MSPRTTAALLVTACTTASAFQQLSRPLRRAPVLRSEVAEEEKTPAEEVKAAEVEVPATPAYSTLNGWTADPEAFAWGLPGALAPVGPFDPAGFLTNDAGEKKTLGETKMLREAEVTHGRVSMLAALGFLVQEQWHPLFEAGNKDLGPAIFHLDEVRSVAPAFFEVLTLFIGIAEVARATTGWTNPAKKGVGPLGNLPENTVRALEDNYYPGDIGFDPLGLKPSSADEFSTMATKELQNGRLAMLAVAGFFAQELTNELTITDTLNAMGIIG